MRTIVAMAAFILSRPCVNSSITSFNTSKVQYVEDIASIFIPTVSVFGITCNLLNICVLLSFIKKSCFHRLLCFLAILDNLHLISRSILAIVPHSLCDNPSSSTLLTGLYYVFLFLETGGCWMTLAIAIERYLGICHPLRCPLSLRKARHFLLPVLLASLLDTAAVATLSQHSFLVHTLPCHVLPCLALVFLNTSIIVTMMGMDKVSGSSREKMLEGAFVLISVVVVYILSQTPHFVKNLLKQIGRADHQEEKKILSIVGDSAVVLNSSVNFLLYCAVGKQYRANFRETFVCRSGGHNSEGNPSSQFPSSLF